MKRWLLLLAACGGGGGGGRTQDPAMVAKVVAIAMQTNKLDAALPFLPDATACSHVTAIPAKDCEEAGNGIRQELPFLAQRMRQGGITVSPGQGPDKRLDTWLVEADGQPAAAIMMVQADGSPYVVEIVLASQ